MMQKMMQNDAKILQQFVTSEAYLSTVTINIQPQIKV